MTVAAGEPNLSLLEHAGPGGDGDVEVDSTASTAGLYHERQRGRLCGLHCVNNLLQRSAYRAKDFDRLERQLGRQQASLQSPSAPSRLRRVCSALSGRADFHVQALELALHQEGFDLQWFDRRRSVEELRLSDPDLLGVIVNLREMRRSCCSRWEERHWLGIRKVDKEFLNLDSLLSQPVSLGDALATSQWLEELLLDGQSCVFRVVRAVVVSGQVVQAEPASGGPPPLQGKVPEDQPQRPEQERDGAAAPLEEAAAKEVDELSDESPLKGAAPAAKEVAGDAQNEARRRAPVCLAGA